jgi:hypothetical protein
MKNKIKKKIHPKIKKNILLFNMITYIFFFIVFFILFLYYAWLSVNPMKYNNGNKDDVLKYIEKYTMKFISINYKKDFNFNNLKYPKIFKPIICSGVSKNLKIINNAEEALNYHSNITDNYIIQDINYYKYEVGLLYERLPFQDKGNIISIYKRKFNNYNKLNICNYNDSTEKPEYIDKNNLITKELIDKIDEIIKKIPNLYACRLDIKYDNDKDFSKGKKFIILEVNGVMGFDLGFNYNKNLLKKILSYTRWIFSRLLIGLLNILSFNGANIYNVFFKIDERIKIFYKCKDHEKLLEYVYT